MVLRGKRYYRKFLEAGEGIATNVLADRLVVRLEQAGLIRKRRDPEDGKRNVYTLTEKGIDTLPILLEIIAWAACLPILSPTVGSSSWRRPSS